MAGTFKLALVQMPVVGGSRDVNLAHALDRISEAAKLGSQVVLLPETMTLGWTHGSASARAEEIPEGPSCRMLGSAARRHGVFVCAGLVERAGDSLFNAAVLINPAGEVVLHHRKLNELDIAQDLYSRGDRLAVARTPLATFGVMICADAFAPGQVVSRALGMMGAQVILSPCAWAVPADHDNEKEPYGSLWLDNYGPPARDFRMWIAGASNVGRLDEGPWKGRKCIGCSLVVGPDGKPVLRGPYGPEAATILYVDIELDPGANPGFSS